MFNTTYIFNWLELSHCHVSFWGCNALATVEVKFCKQALQTTAEKQRGIEKPSIHKTP